MATAAVVRSNQPPRRPRDPPRLSLGKRSANADGAANMANKKRKLDEPYVWDSQYILQKHKGKPPSLIIHLHPTHFKFDGQDGSFAYDSDAKFVIEHIKKQTVPHQMMPELLKEGTTFYEGCLIVEVHNHRKKNGSSSAGDDSSAGGNKDRFSMHKYTAYITPSAYEPYPEHAQREEETPEKSEVDKREMPAPEKPKEKEGPQIFTVVLHPTELSRYHEICILAETPAELIRSKKRGSDVATPSSAHPGSVPPTPMTQTARGQSQKMYLEADDLYNFQADVLVTTNPPLYLEPVDNPWAAEKVLDMLQHPLHQERPPSPKTRKRTTAEVAADDAQQQETERRMLIMDERIKGSGVGAGANENQGAASALTFSRFKTIDMVKTKLDEDKLKREEEQRLAQEKKNEENMLAQQRAARQRLMAQQAQQQAQQQQQQQQQQQPHQQQLSQQQQQHAMMVRAQQQAAMAHAQQQAQMNQHGHAHPQHNNMMPNQQSNMQQGNQNQMTQASPVVRQQTPMMNSSPMVQQGGFPMAQTSSQGARSPPRPTSAAMQQHPMARQVSQQQQPMSRNATPQMAQGTPSMGQAMPNRQMAQTPRMQPGSPANGMQQGTPVTNAMQMQTPQMGSQPQLTSEQMAIFQQARAMQAQQQGRMAGSPTNNMTPEQFQQIQNRQRSEQMRQHLMQVQAAVQPQGNPQMAAQMQHRQQQIVMLRRQQALAAQQQNAQMQGSPGPGQAGSPGQVSQQTPQMGHAHPQQQFQNQMQNPNLTQEQRMVMAQTRASQLAGDRQNFQQQQQGLQAHQKQQINQQLQTLAQQYGSVHNIPPAAINNLPAPVRNYAIQQIRQANAQRMHQQQQQQSQQQQGGNNMTGNVEQVPGGSANPEYMQQLRNNQEMLARQQANMRNPPQQGGGNAGGVNGMTGLSFHMNGLGGRPQTPGGGFAGQQQGQQGQPNLDREFAAMQNAMARGNTSQGNGQ